MEIVRKLSENSISTPKELRLNAKSQINSNETLEGLQQNSGETKGVQEELRMG